MTPSNLPIENYDLQLAEKVDRLTTLMSPFNTQNIDVYRSPVCHYRMRAEFRIWHDGSDLYHIIFDKQTRQFDKQTRQRIRVDEFPAASLLINRLMTRIIGLIRENSLLRCKLFQIDYLSTLSGQILITLLYHRKLDHDWQTQAIHLRNTLRCEGFELQLIGRASKTKICLDRDYVDEVLPVAGHRLTYRQIENSFTQPNAMVNIQMLEWALNVTAGSCGDLTELYCGNGNFSLALARNFHRVLATEIAAPSVAVAQHNIAVNNIDNVKIIRMAAEEFAMAMRGEKLFNRLQGIDLAGYQCKTILVDPPRSGLDEATVKLVRGYPRILYISCNPESLCRDLLHLDQSHVVRHVALFDQFPYTHHLECGVVLESKT